MLMFNEINYKKTEQEKKVAGEPYSRVLGSTLKGKSIYEVAIILGKTELDIMWFKEEESYRDIDTIKLLAVNKPLEAIRKDLQFLIKQYMDYYMNDNYKTLKVTKRLTSMYAGLIKDYTVVCEEIERSKNND